MTGLMGGEAQGPVTAQTADVVRAAEPTAAVLHGTLWLLSEFPGDVVLEPKAVPS